MLFSKTVLTCGQFTEVACGGVNPTRDYPEDNLPVVGEDRFRVLLGTELTSLKTAGIERLGAVPLRGKDAPLHPDGASRGTLAFFLCHAHSHVNVVVSHLSETGRGALDSIRAEVSRYLRDGWGPLYPRRYGSFPVDILVRDKALFNHVLSSGVYMFTVRLRDEETLDSLEPVLVDALARVEDYLTSGLNLLSALNASINPLVERGSFTSD